MRAFFHKEQLQHHPKSYFSRGKMRSPQEIPQRAERLVQAARDIGLGVHSPADHGLEAITAVHHVEYVNFLQNAYTQWKAVPEDWGDEVMSNVFVREPNAMTGILAHAARFLADGSCPIGAETWMSAYWSAQSAIAGALAVMEGDPAAYAICRPPGHHARSDAAGGFCYLNNAAIAAQHMRSKFSRVAVLDTDMHHGQGIQEIFYERNDVLYVSVHGNPTNFYPAVAGFENEHGAGAGEGFNLNLTMAHGSSEARFFEQLTRALQAIRDFDADSLVLALGFDIYERDPQSKVAVTTDGFRRFGEQIRKLRLPCVIVQEGGYHLETLEENAKAFFGDPAEWGYPPIPTV